MRRIALAVAVLLSLLASVATAGSLASTKTPITATVKPVAHRPDKAPSRTERGKSAKQLRILGINDFHGNLEATDLLRTPTGPDPAGNDGTRYATTLTGGAAFLATHVKQLSAGRDAVLVGAGDLIGASPLISGLLHDEPAIESLNAMGLDFAGVGNHEFDEGLDELLRMQNGGCHPTDTANSCRGGGIFSGAAFRYLAANVRYAGTERTIFPPYKIKRAGGVPVAYIGLTLKDTPKIVTPEGVRGLEFDAEPAVINRLVEQLSRNKGVETFVIAIHQGGQQNGPYPKHYPEASGCNKPSGAIFDMVDELSDKVDVVVSAHTHQAYVCEMDGKLVTSSSSFGRLVTSIDLTLDPSTKDVIATSARNVLVTRGVDADTEQQALIAKYKAVTDPIANRRVGSTSAPITQTAAGNGESALGDVIADAQLLATAAPGVGGAKVAFMNPGGIRADLPAGDITYGQLYTTQPFGNTVVVKTLTGAQLDAVLEQQFRTLPSGAAQTIVLQVSQGFTYAFDPTRAVGDRVDPSTIKIDGVTVSPTTGYRVTMNSFLATGGDGFTVFNQGTDQLGGAVDLDALEAYFAANSPVGPGPQNRITRIG